MNVRAYAFLLLCLTLALGCGGDDSVGTVEGAVTLDGEPVSLAEVWFVFRPPEDPAAKQRPRHPHENTGRKDRVAYTDRKGRYSLTGLEPGEYQIRVSKWAGPDGRPVRPDAGVPIHSVLPYSYYNGTVPLATLVAAGKQVHHLPLTSRAPTDKDTKR